MQPLPNLPADAVQRMRRAAAAQQRGDHGVADASYQALIRDFPDFAEAWHYYGLLRYQRGEGDVALPYLRRAQALRPDDPVLLLNFGRVLLELGQFEHAAACLERAVQTAPDSAPAITLHARAVLALGRGDEAVAALERCVASGRSEWTQWMLLGDCRDQAGDRTGAGTAFDHAARLAPTGELAPGVRRAEVAMRVGDAVRAESEFRALLKSDPGCAPALLGLANLASQAGDFEQTADLAEATLRHDHRMYGAWALLAANPRTANDAAFLHRLENAARTAVEDSESWPMQFAVGEALERHGEYDRAFDAYRLGNRLQGRARRYTPQAQEAYVRDIITALDRSFVARAARIGISGGPPIFVCGMPRSGTTLVESILASHPEVAAGGEMLHIHDRLRRELGLRGLVRTGPWLAERTDAELGQLARAWHRVLTDAAGPARHLTDKMPSNYHLIGLIHVCFPDAPIIHLRRDRLDNAVSCYTTSFQEGHSFANALESIAHYFRLHDRLMEHWRQTLGAERIYEVEYESLVRDPQSEIPRLVAAAGLEWHPGCLEFHRSRHAVRTASVYQVRRPLFASSIGRWRRFERHLGPLADALARPLPL